MAVASTHSTIEVIMEDSINIDEVCEHPEEALQKDIYSNGMPHPYYKEWIRIVCKKCNKVLKYDADE